MAASSRRATETVSGRGQGAASASKPRRARLRAGALVALTVVLGGCGVRNRRTPDDTLVVAIENTILDLDPRFVITNYDAKLSRLIVPGLTTTDQQSMEPRLDLAEAITRVDPVTWDAVLRPGLRFSDNTPVTADDVVYAYQSTMDEATGSMARRGFTERFARVEALDERRVRFHLVQPVGSLLSDLEFGIFSHAAARRGGGRFDDGRVIGAGPYRVVSFHAERVVLERNPHYFGQPPAMDKIVVRTVRDANARALMLVGGSADLIQNSVRMDLVDDIAERERVHIDCGSGAILSYLMMNNQDPVLADVRVRRAIAFAINRQQIVDVKFQGRAVLATGLLPPAHWAYTGEVARYPYDPARARALLDQAGYPDPDGPGGAPRLRLVYKTSANQFRVAIARIIADQLGEVGIEVEVRAFEFGTFFMDIKRGNYQLSSMQTAAIVDPDWAYVYFHSSRIPSPEDIHLHNRWRYRNPRIDELVEAGRHEVDRARRVEIYGEVQHILADDLPVIPLWHEDNVAVMNIDVTGYQLFPNASFGGLVTATKAQ